MQLASIHSGDSILDISGLGCETMSLCKRHGLHPLRNRYCSLFACRLGTSRETREFWPSVFAKLRCAHLDRNNMDGIGGAPLPVCLPFCLQRSGPYWLTMKRGLLHSSPAVRESSTVRTFETVALHTRPTPHWRVRAGFRGHLRLFSPKTSHFHQVCTPENFGGHEEGALTML